LIQEMKKYGEATVDYGRLLDDVDETLTVIAATDDQPSQSL